MQDFISAITDQKVPSYRFHAKLPDGTIGITAYYTEAEIENVRKQIIDTGGTILKEETQE